IGSGIAGIATSIRLRKKGYNVDVFEANNYPGGKLTSFIKNGFRFDAGPSLLTMPNLVEELFELFEEDASQYFQYKKKEVVCNYFWEDGTIFSVDADAQKFAKDASKKFGVAEGKITNYLNRSRKKYELTAPIFLEKSLHQSSTYFSKETLRSFLQLGSMDIMNNLNYLNKKSFQEPHLVQMFNRYATYNGSSPYKTPGIMSMIPHLELHLGTFFPKGGMQNITNSLYELATKKGVNFHFSKRVKRILIENKRAIGIETEQETVKADLVISNMDIFPSYKKLMPDEKHPEQTLKQERSSSALIFYWGINRIFPELDLHNILFSKNYKDEFKTIFEKKNISDDPTIYINITCKEEKNDAPKGSENWFVMVNTPGDYGQNWEKIIALTKQQILKKIKRTLGVSIEKWIVTEEILNPKLIEEKTSSYRGSLYGAASNSKFAAFLRHPNFSQKIKNLYFCGGSVHPGGGIPLCLLSAKIVADQIKEIKNR
ncbi:MAG: phytoene desaturase family protein, partial [Saprospiraceae bacterium]|nr:phytoene desaturase family protein [Saprospiraceae bacterium]